MSEIKTKYTPGPWTAENSAVIGRDNQILLVCYRGCVDRASDEEDYATARLIAAAPELLEALKNLLVAGTPIPSDWPQAIAAREAIVKAEGES